MDNLWGSFLLWVNQIRMVDPKDLLLTFLIGVILVLAIDRGYRWIFERKRGRTMGMTRKQRERYRIRCLTDIITDGVELYVREGLLTRYDAGVMYKKVGIRMGWKDILPRSVSNMADKVRNILHHDRFWGYRKPQKEAGKRKRSSSFKPA